MEVQTKKNEALQRALNTLFGELNSPGNPGIAVGVYQGGCAVHLAGFGHSDLEHNVPITPQTVFHVASVSKQFVAFALALLARDGKLDLNADIRKYLPYVPDFGKTITVSQLIHHTSGLRDQWALFDLGGQEIDNRLRQQQIINMVSRQRGLNYDPGAEYSYSNTGYTLMAEIVLATSGSTLREFTTERMFKPLGMTRTFFHDDVTEVVPDMAHSYRRGEKNGWRRALLNYDNVGATSLFTTAEDMTKWAGNFGHPIVGDAELINQVCTMGTLGDGTPINYGFALKRTTYAGHEAVEHSGGDAAFRSWFAYFPEADFSVNMLANHDPGDWNKLISTVVDVYVNGADGSNLKDYVPAAIAPDSKLLDALAGSYIDDFEPLATLERDADGLVWKTAGGDPQRVVFRDDGTFDLGNATRSWRRYRAKQDSNGRVVALEDTLSKADNGYESVYHRFEPVTPSPQALAKIAGDYRSPELDITYTFSIENGQLTARSIWSSKPITFVPSREDRFDATNPTMSIGIVEVRRDARGEVSGLLVHGGRTRHILLERV